MAYITETSLIAVDGSSVHGNKNKKYQKRWEKLKWPRAIASHVHHCKSQEVAIAILVKIDAMPL